MIEAQASNVLLAYEENRCVFLCRYCRRIFTIIKYRNLCNCRGRAASVDDLLSTVRSDPRGSYTAFYNNIQPLCLIARKKKNLASLEPSLDRSVRHRFQLDVGQFPE